MGAWIEILILSRVEQKVWSLPSWERGLKLDGTVKDEQYFIVAPLVGAWIEINDPIIFSSCVSVAPLVGAWIEIKQIHLTFLEIYVAPLVGAWIEIIVDRKNMAEKVKSLPSWERGLKYAVSALSLEVSGRSPRGSVD